MYLIEKYIGEGEGEIVEANITPDDEVFNVTKNLEKSLIRSKKQVNKFIDIHNKYEKNKDMAGVVRKMYNIISSLGDLTSEIKSLQSIL